MSRIRRIRLCQKPKPESDSKPMEGMAEQPARHCGPKVENCPEVRIYKKSVVITDDFGGKVRMTREQFAILRQFRL